MKQKLTLILLCLAIGISGAFTSCKNDAPDIVVKSQTTYTSDFKGIANAINDQSVAIEEKLNLLNTALGDVNLTLDQKLDLIEQAIQNGVTTYKECAKNLIDAINKLQLTQEAKLQAIYDILKSSNATLAQKLADIEAAIKAGIGSYELCAQALIDQINALNVSRADKLQAIYDVLKSSFATLEAKVELVKLAIANGFITNVDAINALNEAIVAQLKYNKEDLAGSIDDITKSIVLVKGSIDAGFVLTNTTMNVAVQALCVGLTTANWTVNASLRAVEAAIKLLSLNVTLDSTKILKQLELIKEAILKGNDYSGIIAAIKSLLPQPEREAVDLGLSVDWATCNLGAEKPEEFGDYYGFGMITPYAPDEGSGWKQYWEALGVQGATSKWTCGSSNDPLRDFLNTGICSTNWDAVFIDLGSDWRMPTKDELNELLKNTRAEWTTVNGVNGVKFWANGNSIFLPAAGYKNDKGHQGREGYYLTGSSRTTFMPQVCYALNFDDEYTELVDNNYRCNGLTIRPVKVKK